MACNRCRAANAGVAFEPNCDTRPCSPLRYGLRTTERGGGWAALLLNEPRIDVAVAEADVAAKPDVRNGVPPCGV